MFEQVLNFLVSTAHADPVIPAPPEQAGGGFSFIIMFAVFFVFIYFAIWRPQNKRAKEQQNLLNAITKGDEVVTAGGLLGRVNKLSGAYITLTIANNVDIVMQKSTVVAILPKGTLKSME